MNPDFKIPEFISPSTVNSFVQYKHSWYMQKVLGASFSSTHYFERGKAVEEGTRLVLEGESLEDATSAANKMMRESFEKLSLSQEDRDECVEYALKMRDYIKFASDGLRKYGELNDRKDPSWTKLGVRIEYKHPKVPIPFYGFLDFKYDDVVVDLKVKSKKPSSLDQGYIYQGLIYQWGTGLPVVFEQLSENKSGFSLTPFWVNKEPYLIEHERALIAATHSLIAVYEAIDEGDPEKLIRAMSFPNLSAVWNMKEKDALYEEFVMNCPFVSFDSKSPFSKQKENDKEKEKKEIREKVMKEESKEESKEEKKENKKKCPL